MSQITDSTLPQRNFLRSSFTRTRTIRRIHTGNNTTNGQWKRLSNDAGRPLRVLRGFWLVAPATGSHTSSTRSLRQLFTEIPLADNFRWSYEMLSSGGCATFEMGWENQLLHRFSCKFPSLVNAMAFRVGFSPPTHFSTISFPSSFHLYWATLPQSRPIGLNVPQRS